jgi:hypothetical protein
MLFAVDRSMKQEVVSDDFIGSREFVWILRLLKRSMLKEIFSPHPRSAGVYVQCYYILYICYGLHKFVRLTHFVIIFRQCQILLIWILILMRILMTLGDDLQAMKFVKNLIVTPSMSHGEMK